MDVADTLGIWTVTHRPRDLPGVEYAARLHYVGRGATWPSDRLLTAPSLEAIRRALPPGLYNLGRVPDDDPAIVESWV